MAIKPHPYFEMSSDPQLRVRILFDNSRFAWATTYYDDDVLRYLEEVLHPETVDEDLRDTLPKTARELLADVIAAISIKWEDLPDHPDSAQIQNN